MKKIALSLIFVVIAFIPVAQGQGMNEGDMQNIMKAMQKVQECMAKVDQSDLAALEQRGEEMEAEIKALCDQGKRDKAQKKAIAFSKEMMKNPALQQMKKCGEISKGMLPEGSVPEMEDDEFDPSKGHVCDEE